MLQRFEVEGFRNFGKRLVLDFSDTRDYRFNSDALSDGMVKCGIVYGRNAIGKTNLCNAFFDITANVGRPIELRDETNYLTADGIHEEASFLYGFRFGDNSVEYEYAKASRNSLRSEALRVNGEVAYSYDHIRQSMLGGNLSIIGANSLNWEFKAPSMSILNYICNNVPVPQGSSPIFDTYRFVYSMVPITDAYMSNRSFVSDISGRIIRRGLVKELETFLKDFGIDESLVVKKVPSGEDVLYFEKSRLVPFVENCSSGTVALLRVFNYFQVVKEPSFLFIDEFDAFYHHDLAEGLVRYFKQRPNRQVLCASHNTDLFSNKVLRPDCLFILTRDKITSAANATKRELREGHNLEKLYKSGEFDG